MTAADLRGRAGQHGPQPGAQLLAQRLRGRCRAQSINRRQNGKRIANPGAVAAHPCVQPAEVDRPRLRQRAPCRRRNRVLYGKRGQLRRAADERGVFLSDEVMDIMLNRFSRDLSSLMLLLDQLDAYALRTQRAITIPLIKSMLENE